MQVTCAAATATATTSSHRGAIGWGVTFLSVSEPRLALPLVTGFLQIMYVHVCVHLYIVYTCLVCVCGVCELCVYGVCVGIYVVSMVYV